MAEVLLLIAGGIVLGLLLRRAEHWVQRRIELRLKRRLLIAQLDPRVGNGTWRMRVNRCLKCVLLDGAIHEAEMWNEAGPINEAYAAWEAHHRLAHPGLIDQSGDDDA